MGVWGDLVVSFILGYIILEMSLEIGCQIEIEEEKPGLDKDGILVLNKTIFDEKIKSSKYFMVMFFSPVAEKTKALLPIYAEVTAVLKEEMPDVVVGRMDSMRHNEVFEKFELPGTPIIVLFSEGGKTFYDYTGDRTKEGIITWVKRKTGPPARELHTVEEAKEFVASKNVTVIGFFKDLKGKESTGYLSAAEFIDDVDLAITDKEEIFQEYKVEKQAVVMFKEFDETRKDFTGEMDVHNIGLFIMAYMNPAVTEFTWAMLNKYTTSEMQFQVFFFVSGKDPKLQEYIEELRTVAKEFRRQVVFAWVDVDNEEFHNMFPTFQITKEDAPLIRAFQSRGDDRSALKYAPPLKHLSAPVIRSFIQSILDKTIRPLFASAELPVDWDKKPIKVLVGKNFQEVAMDKSKDVLVTFVASWCLQCDVTLEILEKLATEFKDHEDLIIAKTDFSENEYKGLQREGFPAIRIFPKDSDEEIEFHEKENYENLKEFIVSRGKRQRGAKQDEDSPKEEL